MVLENKLVMHKGVNLFFRFIPRQWVERLVHPMLCMI